MQCFHTNSTRLNSSTQGLPDSISTLVPQHSTLQYQLHRHYTAVPWHYAPIEQVCYVWSHTVYTLYNVKLQKLFKCCNNNICCYHDEFHLTTSNPVKLSSLQSLEAKFEHKITYFINISEYKLEGNVNEIADKDLYSK